MGVTAISSVMMNALVSVMLSMHITYFNYTLRWALEVDLHICWIISSRCVCKKGYVQEWCKYIMASYREWQIKLSAYSIPLNHGSEINEGLKKEKLNVSQRMEMMKEIAETLIIIRNTVFHPTDDHITTVTSQVFKNGHF